ncbi:MAG: 4Fe-4S dicluster domain-containing protein [Candidatus Riflebacteria bacterium]|nr:4Fe-4S dicluster domain-containing protein [Candidatus Riflebacteria bacterium]
MDHSGSLPTGTVSSLVARATGTSPLACYQCGRCAAGCPQNVAGEMDLSPTQILRLLQLEIAFATDPSQAASLQRRALGADTPWLCAGCQACSSRCPQGVDVAGVMDVLRQESLRRGLYSGSPQARSAMALHKTFMEGVLRRGRIHELTLVALYKLRTMNLFEDALLGPAMFLKGKLHLLPPAGHDTTAVRRAVESLKRRREEWHGPAAGEKGSG